MTDDIKRILKPVASLRLTVGLLFISMLLVLAGTTAQRDMGIQDVQHQFFHSWIAKIQLHYFQPTPSAKPGHPLAPGQGYIPGAIYLPGGYSLIIAILVNLIAAHSVRFKLRAKRIGIILIHSGLILLLVGEFVTSQFAVESRMTIDVGGSANFSQDIREAELAFVTPSADEKNRDEVVVVPQSLLTSVGSVVHDSKLPFDIKIERWYDNSMIRGPAERGSGIDRLADTGPAKIFGMERVPKVAGTEGERIDVPSTFVTLSKNGKPLGTYLASIYFDGSMLDMPGVPKSQDISVDGKTYRLALRFRRDYKPYTIYLKKFTHDVFPGTDTPRDYASDIRLVDDKRHVDREVRIWMNHPLRYAGETFYQQSFANQDRTSIIQIVHNPAWRWPYVACAIGALGMVLHFGMVFNDFLRRRLAPSEGTVGAMAKSPARISHGRAKSKQRKAAAVDSMAYRLSPEPRWKTLGIPLAIVGLSTIYILSLFVPRTTPGPYSIDEFGRIPVSFEGRVQPLDSVARNNLGIVSGGRTSFPDAEGKEHPAIEWLLDVMTQSGHWKDDKVIRIDHPELKTSLGLKETEKMFSWKEIDPDNREAGGKIQEQARLASAVSAKDRDAFQNQVLNLNERLNVYRRFEQVDAISNLYQLSAHPEKAKEMSDGVRSALLSVDPRLLNDIQSGKIDNPEMAMFRTLMRIDRAQLPPNQARAIADFQDFLRSRLLVSGLDREIDLYFAAPATADGKWQPLASAIRDPQPEEASTPGDGQNRAAETAVGFLKIVQDYADGKPQDFNADLAAYQSRLQSLPDTGKAEYEAGFNRFDPFLNCTVFYVCVFILALVSTMFWRQALWRTGLGLLILTLVVHTAGLISRIYLSGRPPVTNLYSASIFIGWGTVVFAIGIEAIYRNGIGLLGGAAAGFLSLLVARGFAVGEGDTMKQLQAVLDTNFWLATHVVCVSLGYTATVFAGVLAIHYILRGLFSSNFSADEAKDNARMTYGVVCFAMLFSFVGTILGGIWADQSWGRFWGWDPKENGAILVVLWNALLLHARWSGLVRERGVMVLAIIGNIVTSWSFVGTNMLGIGLHSYGFMNSAQYWLIAFMASQIALAGLGLIPLRFWASRPSRTNEPISVLSVA